MATANLTKLMEKLMTRNVLRKFGFMRSALVVGVGIPFMVAANAFAQVAPEAAPTATPAAQAEAERVIVTGSNIPTAEEVGPNPVLNINRDLINKSGERTTEELIRNLPVANANGVPVSNNATGFTPGAASIALRGFTPEATLLLIDGRRVAPYPLGQGGTTSFFDLNSIPRAAIESIEILKDGASTTYGADAIAGVVNIKFRHDYRGAEATVEYGNTVDGTDSGESSASLLFGIGDDKTQVSGVIDYYRRNSIFNKDRGFSVKGAFVSTNSTPENLSLNRDAVLLALGLPADVVGTPATTPGFFTLDHVDPTTGANVFVLNAAGLTAAGGEATIPGVSTTVTVPGTGGGQDIRRGFFGRVPQGTSALVPAANFLFSTGRRSLFNFDLVSGAYPERENYGGYFNADHKICGDQLVLYADMFYQKSKSHQELAPGATGNFVNTGGTSIIIPPNNNVAPVIGAIPVGAAVGAFNPFNPFQQFISGTSRARLLEFGNRIFDFETDAWMTTIGLKGDKLFDGNWGYDVGFRASEIKNNSTGQLVSNTLFNRVLNANDPIFQPGGQLFGAQPFNPFTDALRGSFPSNNATVNFATVHPNDIDISKLETMDATIYSTQLFKLPAGGVGFAAGGQFRRENLEQTPDNLEIQGDIVGSSRTANTHARTRRLRRLSRKLTFPLVSPEMVFPSCTP